MTPTATIKRCCESCENFLAKFNPCPGLAEGDLPFRPVCLEPAESHPIADANAFGVGDDETHQAQ